MDDGDDANVYSRIDPGSEQGVHTSSTGMQSGVSANPNMATTKQSGQQEVPCLSHSVILRPSEQECHNVALDIHNQLPEREDAWSLTRNYFRVSSASPPTPRLSVKHRLTSVALLNIKNGAWMFDIVSEQEFLDDVFFPTYGNERAKSADPDKLQMLALLCMVLALGALFDLNLPPCRFSPSKLRLGKVS